VRLVLTPRRGLLICLSADLVFCCGVAGMGLARLLG
jgi:hypothetical protein